MDTFNLNYCKSFGLTPERVVMPHSWVGHIPFAFFLVEALKPKVIAELGVHSGNSYNAFCQAVKFFQLDTKCFGVDIWEGDSHAGLYGNEIFEELQAYQLGKYPFSTLLKMTFDEALNQFEDKSIDILHIDGLHTYEAVKYDFETWLPKLSSNSVVLFHDTEVYSNNFGVWKFWKEISSAYPSFNFPYCNGLGVLVVGDKVNSNFNDFFKAVKEAPSIVKEFEDKGNLIFHKYESKFYLQEYYKKTIEAEQLKESIIEKDKRIYKIGNPIRRGKINFLNFINKIQKKEYLNKKLNKILLKKERDLGKKLNLDTKTTAKYRYKEISKERRDEIVEEIKTFNYKPLISLIMPVFNMNSLVLDKAIESVKNQLYANWELCIVDDASTNKETIDYLSNIKDDKIKIKFLSQNLNISGASNQALDLAVGEYIGFLDHDDTLTIDALYEVVNSLNTYKFDLVYSDEDKVTINEDYITPFYKPDFSPDLFLSQNYICHFTVINKTIIDQIGGFRVGFEGAQDYDLFLRAIEKANSIHHIPKILYHWRMIPGSTAQNFSEKSYADVAAMKALNEAALRQNIKADVHPGSIPGTYFFQRKILSNPLVSIIIPFKDKPELITKCINSIINKSTYKNFEIIGVSNNSIEPSTYKALDELTSLDERIKFINYNIAFNYSKINNYAVTFAKGEHIIFLNNDIEIISQDWIEKLLEHSQRKEVGAVGGKLYYPNNLIQHAGVILGINGVAGHSHKYFKREDAGYFNRLAVIQNIAAVTGACLMVKRSLHEKLGGFDEENLPIAFNDVDFCLRLLEKGYFNVFTPYCEAYHYESISRGYEDSPEKVKRFQKEAKYLQIRHSMILSEGDPFYNINLTTSKENYDIKTE